MFLLPDRGDQPIYFLDLGSREALVCEGQRFPAYIIYPRRSLRQSMSCSFDQYGLENVIIDCSQVYVQYFTS